MTYLLDTNSCIYVIKRKLPSVIARLRSKEAEEIAVSTITIAEMEYGIAKSRQPNRNKVALLEFLLPFAILDFDQHAAVHYGPIRSDLESRGTPIARSPGDPPQGSSCPAACVCVRAWCPSVPRC